MKNNTVKTARFADREIKVTTKANRTIKVDRQLENKSKLRRPRKEELYDL